jgi:hypothetical protein
MKKIHPVPEALIQRWEDYSFVVQYEDFLQKITINLDKENGKWYPESDNTKVLAPSLTTIYALLSQMTGEVQAIVRACRALLSQSPGLVCIFHAGRLLTPDISELVNPSLGSHQLLRIHIVLDLPWDDILGYICSLRPLITHESVFFHTLFLFLPALCWELDDLYPAAMVSRNLACGFLRLMKQIGGEERPMAFW